MPSLRGDGRPYLLPGEFTDRGIVGDAVAVVSHAAAAEKY
jgi:hypothetical protein